MVPAADLPLAKQNLAKLQSNTSGYFARKVEESKRKSAAEEAEQRRREQAGGLVKAAAMGDMPQLRFLLQQEEQDYALEAASERAPESVFHSVLVNQTDQEGRIPLHYAACYGHRDAVALLCGAGSDLMARDSVGFTPMRAWRCTLAKLAVAARIYTPPQTATDRHTPPHATHQRALLLPFIFVCTLP